MVPSGTKAAFIHTDISAGKSPHDPGRGRFESDEFYPHPIRSAWKLLDRSQDASVHLATKISSEGVNLDKQAFNAS